MRWLNNQSDAQRLADTSHSVETWLGIGTRRFVQRLTTNAGFDRFYL